MPPTWIPSYEVTMERLSASKKFDAEKRVAEALNKITSSDVTILHSVEYSVHKKVGAAVNLEKDFLVVWKHRGFLILEVKGGPAEYDAIENKWWITRKNHPRKEYSRSPVAQVNGQKTDLCNETLSRLLSSKLNPRSIVERVLVFPDVSRSDFKDQHGHRAKIIDGFEIEDIADSDSMQLLADFVEKKLENTERYVLKHDIHGKLFEDTINYLRPSVRAEVSPQHILEHTASQIEEATNEQKEHLKHVMGARWLLMDGPAGSAKTVLGLSAVLSWGQSGANAYYITENKYLVAGLRGDLRYSQVKDQILSIHDFLEQLLGVKIEDSDDALYNALMEWEIPDKGICLVIDEVQDLSEKLYEALVKLLPCERLWVLRDNRQSLEWENDGRCYNLGPLSDATPYSLTKNCRNVRQIAEHIVRYVGLPNDYINDFLPLGDRLPDVIMVSSLDEQNQELLKALKQALKDGYAQENIVVISCHSGGSSAVREKYCSFSGRNTWREKFSYGGKDSSKVAIYYSLDFRGLESPFVIVTDIQDQESIFRANYLAGSRAKFRLVLIRVKDQISREPDIPEELTFG